MRATLTVVHVRAYIPHMNAVHMTTAPIDCHTGSTDRGELWLVLVFVDSEDERDELTLAVPVDGESVDWAMARDHESGAPADRRVIAALPTWQTAEVVPPDYALVDAWEESGGREARRAWMRDNAH